MPILLDDLEPITALVRLENEKKKSLLATYALQLPPSYLTRAFPQGLVFLSFG